MRMVILISFTLISPQFQMVYSWSLPTQTVEPAFTQLKPDREVPRPTVAAVLGVRRSPTQNACGVLNGDSSMFATRITILTTSYVLTSVEGYSDFTFTCSRDASCLWDPVSLNWGCCSQQVNGHCGVTVCPFHTACVDYENMCSCDLNCRQSSTGILLW
jgi:hypothetical protein